MTQTVFSNAVNLSDLVGTGYIDEALYDETCHKAATDAGIPYTNTKALVVLSRETVIEFITRSINGISQDIARFSLQEKNRGDCLILAQSLTELCQGLEKIEQSPAQTFYILP